VQNVSLFFLNFYEKIFKNGDSTWINLPERITFLQKEVIRFKKTIAQTNFELKKIKKLNFELQQLIKI